MLPRVRRRCRLHDDEATQAQFADLPQLCAHVQAVRSRCALQFNFGPIRATRRFRFLIFRLRAGVCEDVPELSDIPTRGKFSVSVRHVL